jgi:hypothetical protein
MSCCRTNRSSSGCGNSAQLALLVARRRMLWADWSRFWTCSPSTSARCRGVNNGVRITAWGRTAFRSLGPGPIGRWRRGLPIITKQHHARTSAVGSKCRAAACRRWRRAERLLRPAWLGQSANSDRCARGGVCLASHSRTSWPNTFLASAGQSLIVIGDALGHASPTTTSRYVHLFDTTLRAGVRRGAHRGQDSGRRAA